VKPDQNTFLQALVLEQLLVEVQAPDAQKKEVEDYIREDVAMFFRRLKGPCSITEASGIFDEVHKDTLCVFGLTRPDPEQEGDAKLKRRLEAWLVEMMMATENERAKTGFAILLFFAVSFAVYSIFS